jgi:hypothetical protein
VNTHAFTVSVYSFQQNKIEQSHTTEVRVLYLAGLINKGVTINQIFLSIKEKYTAMNG